MAPIRAEDRQRKKENQRGIKEAVDVGPAESPCLKQLTGNKHFPMSWDEKVGTVVQSDISKLPALRLQEGRYPDMHAQAHAASMTKPCS